MGFWQLVSILSRLVSPQLTRIGSDHSPLLLLQNQTNSSTQKPFRYENMRHTHPLFENWAYTHWATLQGHLMDKLHVMSSSLSTWNRQTFGNLFSKLSRLSNHIQGIQASPSYHHSTFLHHLERDLLNQHAQKIHQVPQFWAQQAHQNWLTQGVRTLISFTLLLKSFIEGIKSYPSRMIMSDL